MRERVGSLTRATREFLWVGVSASRGNFQPKESELESTEMRERERECHEEKHAVRLELWMGKHDKRRKSVDDPGRGEDEDEA